MPTAPTPSLAAERLTGIVIEWNESKGYGFLDDGRHRVFAHIRDFTERPRLPKSGDKVTYSLGVDRQGRSCAQRIDLQFTGVPLRLSHFVFLALMLATPGCAIYQLLPRERALGLGGWVILASLISYGLYSLDKKSAQRGDWRIPERFLHFWELVGGWPGAFLAQRHLRHKSAKISYLFTFWLIIGIHHYLAIDAQLDWHWFHQIKAWLETLN